MTRLPALLWTNARALGLGALGAALAYLAALPAALLIGPALVVSLAGLAGARLSVSPRLMQICLVVLGLGVGSGFSAEAGRAVLHWPLAFAVLGLALVAILWSGQQVLMRLFHFDPVSASLASAPGHLSFVLASAADTGSDVARIAVAQTLRVLVLTLSVPFVALALGVRMAPGVLPQGVPMPPLQLIVLALVGVALGVLFRRLKFPAPLLLGPMVASAGGHVTGLSTGSLPLWLSMPAFLVMGTVIGTRFSGVSLALLRSALMAGLAVTAISVAVMTLAAFPVALALAMPTAHVLTGFAPGGLETMIALGAAMGANPGFITACHVLRLLILSALIPLTLRRARRAAQPAR
ncbi:AbrB family transcriptional regulator [Pseudodonghicola flavimaris]|uniref:AbrB family transcriptional regulator n=1 Tax=Pseudodonghicola flavimaris TaxID=3050036 RepID=A0ABT7EVK2_9RHOB|nr:AbrB family transcriptional regulator [Pseudodonghicola flavimaris]MDK3016367.1 AbrB family transcriptional regulator [Pseudodonghicola flavimaris]